MLFWFRTIPCFALPHLPFNERSVCFASLRNFGRSTSGIHARPRKRVRFCCSVKPSQLWWGLLPIRTIIEIFRTIPQKLPSPLPLNERSVGFALSLALHYHTCLPSKKGEVLLLGQAEPTVVGITPHPHHQ